MAVSSQSVAGRALLTLVTVVAFGAGIAWSGGPGVIFRASAGDDGALSRLPLQICKEVAANDNGINDSGTFTFSITGGNPSGPTLSLTATEGQTASGNPSQCGIVTVDATAEVTVAEIGRPAGWIDAPNYPNWTLVRTIAQGFALFLEQPPTVHTGASATLPPGLCGVVLTSAVEAQRAEESLAASSTPAPACVLTFFNKAGGIQLPPCFPSCLFPTATPTPVPPTATPTTAPPAPTQPAPTSTATRTPAPADNSAGQGPQQATSTPKPPATGSGTPTDGPGPNLAIALLGLAVIGGCLVVTARRLR